MSIKYYGNKRLSQYWKVIYSKWWWCILFVITKRVYRIPAFTVPNIKLPEVKEIFRNCTDGTLQIFAISSLQYRLFQSCQEHETPLKMDMSVYEYKCDLENHPNLYVPCFSYMEGNNESFCTQTEDVLSEENIDRFVSLIDNLLDYLDAKNII